MSVRACVCLVWAAWYVHAHTCVVCVHAHMCVHMVILCSTSTAWIFGYLWLHEWPAFGCLSVVVC